MLKSLLSFSFTSVFFLKKFFFWTCDDHAQVASRAPRVNCLGLQGRSGTTGIMVLRGTAAENSNLSGTGGVVGTGG